MLDIRFALAASLPSSLRLDSKTTRVPSGDHCGEALPAKPAVALVKAVSPVPSAFTPQMLDVPFPLPASLPSSLRLGPTTTRVPACDHFGAKLKAPAAIELVK